MDYGAGLYAQGRYGDDALYILAGMCSEEHALLILSLEPNALIYINLGNKYNDTPLIVVMLYDYYRAASALL